MPGYTLEQAQALLDKAMADKAEWVCSKAASANTNGYYSDVPN